MCSTRARRTPSRSCSLLMHNMPSQPLGLPLWPLGRTALLVTPLGVGCAPLGNMPEIFGYAVTKEQALTTLRAVFGGAISYLDTAASYGDGESERRIGMAIRQQGGLCAWRQGRSRPVEWRLQRRTDSSLTSTQPPSARGGILVQGLEAYAHYAYREASSQTGEHTGACPHCKAGTNRYHIWTEPGASGRPPWRYWCRSCRASGVIGASPHDHAPAPERHLVALPRPADPCAAHIPFYRQLYELTALWAHGWLCAKALSSPYLLP